MRVRLRPGPPSRNCSSRGRLDACAWRDAPAAARATASQLQGSIASLPPALMSSVQPLTLLPLIRSTGQPPPRPPPYAQAHTDHVHARTPADKNRSSGAHPPSNNCFFVSVSAGSAGCGSCLRGRCWVIRLRRAGTRSFALARAPVMSRTHALALPRPSSGPFGQGRNQVSRLRNGCVVRAQRGGGGKTRTRTLRGIRRALLLA